MNEPNRLTVFQEFKQEQNRLPLAGAAALLRQKFFAPVKLPRKAGNQLSVSCADTIGLCAWRGGNFELFEIVAISNWGGGLNAAVVAELIEAELAARGFAPERVLVETLPISLPARYRPACELAMAGLKIFARNRKIPGVNIGTHYVGKAFGNPNATITSILSAAREAFPLENPPPARALRAWAFGLAWKVGL